MITAPSHTSNVPEASREDRHEQQRVLLAAFNCGSVALAQVAMRYERAGLSRVPRPKRLGTAGFRPIKPCSLIRLNTNQNKIDPLQGSGAGCSFEQFARIHHRVQGLGSSQSLPATGERALNPGFPFKRVQIMAK